jgi:GntR family transcriptional regulator, transcriptional repressor for pyruvate dehydrogenase complex
MNENAFPNFKRNKLSDMVFDSLKEKILSGSLYVGQSIPTQEVLTKKFGVSITVIREALHRLSSLGLIESRQGQGTFVRSPNIDTIITPMLDALYLNKTDIAELIETRYFLERLIARLAAKRIQPDQVKELEETILQMKQHADSLNIEEFSRSDFAFHQKLAVISNNNILKRILETIRDLQYKFLLNFSRTKGAPQRAINFHNRILLAVAAKDPDKAEEEMKLHLLDIMNALKRNYDLELKI